MSSDFHSQVSLADIDEMTAGGLSAGKINHGNDIHAHSDLPIGESYWGRFDHATHKFDRCPSAMSKKAFDELLIKAAELKADDVILQGDERVFLKLSNVLYPVSNRPLTFAEVTELLARMHRESTPGKVRSGQFMDFPYTVPHEDEESGKVKHIRFRVNSTACQGLFGSQDGIEITMRIIAPFPMTMDELGVPEGIRDLAFPGSGIVFVTGETGSGKTTLLGSVIREIATGPLGKHIITYEDPIEYDYRAIPNRTSIVAQTQVGEMIRSFDHAIPNALRRNPCVIMVGEVRDAISINNALIAAQSGHVVYTTVHTEGVAITFSRMVSVFPQNEQRGKIDSLVNSTRGIVHQRLLRTKDGGRIPVQEWLGIGRYERNILFDTPTDQLVPVIQGLVESRGRSLLEDLESKANLIVEDDYQLHRRLLINELPSGGEHVG